MNDGIEFDLSSPPNLQVQLATLTTEHRDLDALIAELSEAPPSGDELLLRRLKKRKLLLKDRIAILQHMLDPDVPA